MSTKLQNIAAYIPPAIIRDVLQSSAPTSPQAASGRRFSAAILFADVSGFTPLTEALSQKGAEGPEELTRLLNRYFSRMIDLIDGEGGDVVKFSGDALTAVFPSAPEALGDAARRAVQAAEAMQAAMVEFETLGTSVGPVALGMKIGIGAGEILAATVGGVEEHWEYVIAGDPLRQVAEAEHHADMGQIILSPEAEALITPHPVSPQPSPKPDWNAVADPDAVQEVLRCFVPRAVIPWMGQSLQEWLAVLRPMSVLFIGITGSGREDDDTVSRLDRAMRAAQEVVNQYEGSINKMAVDDKGTIMVALFGAPPFAHEDDPERAVRCAMALHELAPSLNLELAIGVTTGRVFAGPVGSSTRREYTVMGDTVNLAARLMALAGPGQIRCDYQSYYWARERLGFEVLDPVSLKGKAGLIRVYRPTGQQRAAEFKRASGVLVGRQSEMSQLQDAISQISSADIRTRCILVEGEAGIGKSRLVEELSARTQAQGIISFTGSGRSIEQQTPFRAWRDIFSSFLDIDDIEDPEERRRRVKAHIDDKLPHLSQRHPLLNDLLNLGFPENTLTASMETHLRHESLTSLLLALLTAGAADTPLVLILEDAHWLDSLSWDLALQTVRALTVARAPLLMIVVMRPMDQAFQRTEPAALARMDTTQRISLSSLTPEDTLTLAASRLNLTGPLPKEIADLVSARASGNPFFAEELIYSLRDNGHISVVSEGDGTHCAINADLGQVARNLPSTVEGLVLSRIDRLSPEEQLTLKVAAVIGRTFVYSILQETLGEHMELTQRLLTGYLEDLDELDLTPLEAPEPELSYIFKHIITQEVAYETLLFAQRRQLHHSVAEWYLRRFGQGQPLPSDGRQESPLSLFYPLLVYHWHRAENRDQERVFAKLAAESAAAQFANVEAIGYFNRALELTTGDDLALQYTLILGREKVYDLMGNRESQAQDLGLLHDLSSKLQDGRRSAEVALRRANYQEEISDYPAALSSAQESIDLATAAQSPEAEAEGYISKGRILWRQGKYEAAKRSLNQAVERDYHKADSLYYLGQASHYQNNYPEAQQFYQQAIALYREEGHRQGEADTLTVLGTTQYELGDIGAARDYYQQVLAIFRATGDRRGESTILNNLGIVACDLGDFAGAHEYNQQAMSLYLATDDRIGEAASLVNLGLVLHMMGENESARQRCSQALSIQKEIGDRRGQGFSLTYLGHALSSLGELEAAAEAYDQAMRLRRELGQETLAIDDAAGLARVALSQGDLDKAAALCQEILAWLETNGSAGVEYPLQVRLTCYRVLMAQADGHPEIRQRAESLLAQTHEALQDQAAGISDPALRATFLQNVSVNREIIQAWGSMAGS